MGAADRVRPSLRTCRNPNGRLVPVITELRAAAQMVPSSPGTTIHPVAAPRSSDETAALAIRGMQMFAVPLAVAMLAASRGCPAARRSINVSVRGRQQSADQADDGTGDTPGAGRPIARSDSGCLQGADNRKGGPMAPPPDRNLVINAALAEYTALRAAVTNRINGQDTTLNLYMTATAAIFGLALSGHVNLLILLVLPLLSAAARLLYHNHNLYIRLVSAYLNDQLRPLVADSLGEPRLLGWQQRSAEYHRGPRWRRLAHPAGLALLFPIPAAVALVLVVSQLASPWAWLAWSSGWFLVLAQIVLTNQRLSSVEAKRPVSHTQRPSG